MYHPEHQEDSHGIIQDLSVCTIELRDSCERESKGHAFQEIGVCARIEEEGIWVIVGGSGLLVLVADIFLFLYATIEDSVG